jgi:hypothetical protein
MRITRADIEDDLNTGGMRTGNYFLTICVKLRAINVCV